MKLRLNQTLVYWGPAGVNGFGESLFQDPVELACRWEDKRELFRNKEGQEVMSSSVVYPVSAVSLGGYLFLGTLADLSSAEEDNPRLVQNAKEVRSTGASSNLKGTEWVYKAWL
jgi:hypothetical protein